ncbi:hypothetical protein I350_00298 [Cryptococcus amylolentus CBS 6273]|uniref:Uncharacterized protein n=1 Tax=Cryptococcus amylolentus CBS 6273 TaxID=1296118 RepID=A0A1E3KEK1_9TREE|nr:hypothetical protein I350_00298 [Cryptococcus amylolentus CBS 6273]
MLSRGILSSTESDSSPQPHSTLPTTHHKTIITTMNESDSDRYTIQPIGRWDTPRSEHNPTSPPYIAPGEIPQEPEVDPIASGESGNW